MTRMVVCTSTGSGLSRNGRYRDRIDGGLPQQRWSLACLQVFDRSLARDGGLDDYGALNPRLFCDLWIGGRMGLRSSPAAMESREATNE